MEKEGGENSGPSVVDEREDIQKKTFTKWINSQLEKNAKGPVIDLFEDLRDGELLLSLLEILTAQQYKRERGRMRVHRLHNADTALRALADAGVKLVNISAADIVDGNPKLTLGLVWSIIVSWGGSWSLSSADCSLERSLLRSCAAYVQGTGLVIRDLCTSWRDGRAFAALLSRVSPPLVNYEELLLLSPIKRLEIVFDVANKQLGIPKLLDPEDVFTEKPDKKSIMTYLMCMYQALQSASTDESKDTSPSETQRLPGSRPLSTATTSSTDLGDYSAALEDVLAWLLDAEEQLADAEVDPNQPLQQLKDKFHTHETHLTNVCEVQTRVGNVVESGAKLAASGTLAKDEANEIRLQLRLLAERWDALRNAALAKQSLLAKALTNAQRDAAANLKLAITRIEERISLLPVNPNKRLTAVSALQKELENTQPLVDDLADAVLVMDDDNDDTVSELEDTLSALGERWSHVCRWTQDALRQLQRSTNNEHTKTVYEEMSREGEEIEKGLKMLESQVTIPKEASSAHIQNFISLAQRLQRLKSALQEVDDNADSIERCDALQDIVYTHASRLKTLGFEVNTDDFNPSTTSNDEHKHKRPRLSDPVDSTQCQATYQRFDDWAATSLGDLNQCKEDLNNSTSDRRSILTTIERIERELQNKQADLSQLESIPANLALDVTLQDEARYHSQKIAELKSQWDNIQRTILELRNTINILEDKDSFYDNLQTFQQEIEETHAWKDRMLRDKPSTNQLIHLRNKLRSTKQMETKLKEINAQSIILLTKPLSVNHKQSIEEDTKRINENFEELFTFLSKKEVEIKLAVGKKPKENSEEGFKILQNKIQDIETKIISEHVIISSKEDAQSKIEELHKLGKEFDELQSSYDKVVREKREKYVKGSVQDLNLRSSLDDLVTRFMDSKTILQQKINKLENGITILEQLQSELTSIQQWVKELEKLTKKTVPIGDVPELEILLSSSNKFEEEKPSKKSKIENLESMLDAIREDLADTVSKSLTTNVKDVKKQFGNMIDTSFKYNEDLRRSLEKSEAVFKKIDDIENWLQGIESELPKEEECGIKDSGDLYKMKTRFQELKDKCDDKTDEFRNLNEAGNELLLQAEGRAGILARKITQLNARWSKVTPAVYERYKILLEAWTESGSFRCWVSQEQSWLSGLQRKLAVRPLSDAEEAHDCLCDLENYIASHSTDRLEELRTLGQQLAEAQIMSEWIQTCLNELTDRSNELRQQAAERIADLEVAANAASALEQRVSVLDAKVDNLIVDGERTPQNIEELRKELQSLRSEAESIENDASSQQLGGNLSVATRTAEQLKIVHNKLDQLSAIISPSSSTPLKLRISVASDTLKDIEKRAALAKQTKGLRHTQQLATCLKFYRTLSEIKSEVESIIKTGRKMVEEKVVPEPEELSKQIDALKELYNKLGAQVTESKTKLESAILTSRDIQNDLQSLTTWLDGLGTNIGKQTLELEMSRMEAIKNKLNSNYKKFAEDCGPDYLETLKEQIEGVNERWERLKKHGVVKRGNDIDNLQKYLNDIDMELESPETMSPAKLKVLKNEVKAKASEIELLGNKTLTLLWEKILEKITAVDKSLQNRDGTPEYENVTDTIKRRLESPVNTPESEKTERVEPKKSKIPLAVKSPVPIRKEIKEGGIRSRGGSIERGKRKAESPMTDSVSSTISNESTEFAQRSLPPTPNTPRKNSSTFNLLKDSELFSQISENKLEPKLPPRNKKLKPDPCQVVSVKESEIVKSNVEPIEVYTTDAVETVVELLPQRAETVEIIDDKEDTEGNLEGIREKQAVDLGTEPKTFVVEVRNLQSRMKPTFGILKRSVSSDDEKPKMKNSIQAPDLIPKNEHEATKTPPPTPMDGIQELKYDFTSRQKEVQKLLQDEVNEYLILDEVPQEQPALPEPSVTDEAEKIVEMGEVVDSIEKYKKVGVSIAGSTPERLRRKSGTMVEEEVIYSEVEDMPQLRLASGQEWGPPLSASTPVKLDRPVDQQVEESIDRYIERPSVVGVSPKANVSEDEGKEEQRQSLSNTVIDEAKLQELLAECAAFCRKLTAALVSERAVNVRRQPQQSLEMLTTLQSTLAGEAAGLLSRGHSAVYALLAADARAARRLNAALCNCRRRWTHAHGALLAARRLSQAAGELNMQVEALQQRLDKLESALKDMPQEKALQAVIEAESEVEAIQREPNTPFITKRAMTDLHAAWTRVQQLYEQLHTVKDKKNKPNAWEVRCQNLQQRILSCREQCTKVRNSLHSAPLYGGDYDDFPLQEDALQRVKTSLEELESTCKEVEKECQLASSTKPLEPRLERRRQAMIEDVKRVGELFAQRKERWVSCQTDWARLYATLEQCGGWLDSVIPTLEDNNIDVETFNKIKEQLPHQETQINLAESCTDTVIGACAYPLCIRIEEQTEALLDRWRHLHDLIEHRQASFRTASLSRSSLSENRLAVKTARDLLATSANPSDDTSLNIRLSLVKARCEELGARASQLSSKDDYVAKELREVQSKLSSHGEYVSNKLTALNKLQYRIDEALAKVDSQNATEHESDIRELLENFNNMERECIAAKQTVSPVIREKIHKLHDKLSRESSEASDRSNESHASGNERSRLSNGTPPRRDRSFPEEGLQTSPKLVGPIRP